MFLSHNARCHKPCSHDTGSMVCQLLSLLTSFLGVGWGGECGFADPAKGPERKRSKYQLMTCRSHRGDQRLTCAPKSILVPHLSPLKPGFSPHKQKSVYTQNWMKSAKGLMLPPSGGSLWTQMATAANSPAVGGDS